MNNNKDVLYIVIPAYNEGMNIEQCIHDWYPIVEKYSGRGYSRLVIIDDGSKDETYSIMQKYAETHSLFQPMSKPNGGHGHTVLYGYRYAIKMGATYIFQTDSDGQTNPGEFEQFWEAKEEYDVVLGNRIVRGDGKDRKFVENIVCFFLRVFFGIKIRDANAPFRLMKTSLVEKYIWKLPENFNIPNIMFTTYFVYHHEKVKFIPITFKPRHGGISSINLRKIIKIGWKALGDFWRLRREIDNVEGGIKNDTNS